MNKKTPKTAKELMDELNKNPDFKRREAEKQKRLKELEAFYQDLQRPILDKLSEIGFMSSSISDLVNTYGPLPEAVVKVLLENVERASDARILESLIRALGASAYRFDGSALARCYDEHKDDSIRWAILNTIAMARPHSIDVWIARVRQNPWAEKSLRELGY